MNIYKISIQATAEYGRPGIWGFYGTATNINVANRQAMRSAKKQGFTKTEIKESLYLGEKDFGK